jgi:alginate O-acetyltransferase complex protein AlgI
MSLSFWIRDYLFLPLVMLFSAVWWRYVVLLFSMIVFGLWHKASWTFLAWGMYQGSLLVLHRLWQQLKMRWQFRLPAFVEGPLGWAITFSSICLGWVLFRAPSLGQGAAMLKAAIVPSMGLHHVLPRSLYLLVAAAALGYFAVIGIGEIVVSIGKSRDASGVLHEDISDWRLLNRDRWVWVMPLAIVASLYALVIFEPGQTAASPMLYRLF